MDIHHLRGVSAHSVSISAIQLDGPLLTVAERGEQAESATALVADSHYLYDQFTSSLPTDAGTVEATLRTTVETVVSDLRNRREELPAEPTKGDRELVWRLRYRLHDAQSRA